VELGLDRVKNGNCLRRLHGTRQADALLHVEEGGSLRAKSAIRGRQALEARLLLPRVQQQPPLRLPFGLPRDGPCRGSSISRLFLPRWRSGSRISRLFSRLFLPFRLLRQLLLFFLLLIQLRRSDFR